MSLFTPAREDTFPLIRSEEDRRNITAFTLRHGHVFERLSDAFANAPASIVNGRHVLARPVFMTVDADRVALSRKEPKDKPVPGKGHRVTFSLNARDPGEHGTAAIVMAVAVGTMRIQHALQMCDRIHAAGTDPSQALYPLLDEYIEQIRSASHWLATDILKR
jgi:hypothetical protein